MNVLKTCGENYHQLLVPPLNSKYRNANANFAESLKFAHKNRRKQAVVRGSSGGERRSFLTLEEAGLVEVSGLSTHERFLCRLTISSLNLLRVIAEQEGCSIEELNAGRICDWFLKDKLKREQNLDSAVLQWDESDFQL
ncbi:PREDICTED: uncharacterized protein LOC109207523 [Nicotiana attenuata]|uniref:Uncharacterized protein n=1 Tax=Nicotiana attenuata TaxID=49451 RepID=A0A314KSP2_NICAT|nr:PREDICTED: uncharacterized protein LOC109207523 [Nicotiana attenuata]OIT32303.1 hypothetical protein A4A49_16997 [Nicotiana attenuata]